MERGGAGTAILLILFLLIMVVLLFPNQVEQFLKQFNISLGNGTSNSSQSSQQITNGSQNYVNNGNSYQNYSVIEITFPIFNAGTFNIGINSKSIFVGSITSYNYPSTYSQSAIASTDTNITIYENENNVNFAFSLKYSGGCNNIINSINIQNPNLYILIYSFDPNELSYYNNYFRNLSYITDTNKDLQDVYWTAWYIAKKYEITVQNNQYGFSCKPTGVVQLNPTVTVSCSIDLNQLESDPKIQSIMNEINSAGNSSLWAGGVSMNVSYNCQ
jgi:hypothetical protein